MLESMTARDIILRHYGDTAGNSILAASADSAITANFVFIDHEGINGITEGQIGTSSQSLRLATDFFGAHIHGQITSPGNGIYIDATPRSGGLSPLAGPVMDQPPPAVLLSVHILLLVLRRLLAAILISMLTVT